MSRNARRPRSLPARIYLGLLSAVLLSLWGAFSYYDAETAEQARAENRDPYRIQAARDRFADFLQAVEPGAVLGYISDARPGTVAAGAWFAAAQYAVAPRLLLTGADRRQVLGNFHRASNASAAGAKYGLQVDRDFGDGVVLFRK